SHSPPRRRSPGWRLLSAPKSLSRGGGLKEWNLSLFARPPSPNHLTSADDWLNTMTLKATAPVWVASAQPPDYPELQTDLAADICVIGAGIAGLTTAYLLLREGRSVVLLDGGLIGQGETACTTAHLSNALDDGFADLEKLFGED